VAADPLALLATYAGALEDLEDAGVVWTSNSPVADFAEHLVAYHHKTRPVRGGQRGFDIETAAGEKIQVKALWRRGGRKRRNFSLRGAGVTPPLFDRAVVVIFERDLQTWKAYSYEVQELRALLGWGEMSPAHRVTFGGRLEQASTHRSIELKLPPPSYWHREAVRAREVLPAGG
jgi:hypothetical protein